MTPPLLEIAGLTVKFGAQTAVSNVNLSIAAGDRLGLVGESGSGKSTLGLAILGLLPSSAFIEGRVLFKGKELALNDERVMNTMRGQTLGFVYQDPMSGFSPIHSIERHLSDAIRVANPTLAKQAIREKSIALLEEVEIHNAAERLDHYPHQFSGGMLQRIMIASALAGDPELLIADEPTTALDATTQAAVLALLDQIATHRNMATLLITHDLGVIGSFCRELAVMYSGCLLSLSSVEQATKNPLHPYTSALLDARPRLHESPNRLRTIGGGPQIGIAPRTGCVFEPRCGLGKGNETCQSVRPRLALKISGEHVACHLVDEHAGAQS